MKYLKHFLIWIFFTFIIAILLSSVQMFARMTTLDNVRGIDFKLIHRFIEPQIQNQINENDISYALNALALDNGYVLFPVALMNTEKCLENGTNTNEHSLCKKYKNRKSVDSLLKKDAIDEYYGNSIIRISASDSLLFKEFNNSDYILIGDTGKYLGHTETDNLITFSKTDWLKTYTTTIGIKKAWDKGRYLIYITFAVSIALWFFFVYFSQRKRAEYNLLKIKSDQMNTDWEKLNDDYLNLIQEQSSIDQQIKEYETISEADPESTRMSAEIISKLTEEKNQIEADLARKKTSLLDLEDQEKILNENIESSYSKLSSIDQKNESGLLIEKLNRIKQLWRRGPTWKERKMIETELSENEAFIPFTISQSFIVFEKSVVRVAAQRFTGYDEQLSLYDCIELIKNRSKVREEDISLMHRIRKSRNDWFHNGVRPSEQNINDLIDFLNEYSIEPELI